MEMIFHDIVADPLASQKPLSASQYLLPLSLGMTGCREEDFDICRLRQLSDIAT